mgnify:CR=1 FL=1
MWFDIRFHANDMPAILDRLFGLVDMSYWDRRDRDFDAKSKNGPFAEQFFDSRFSVERALLQAQKIFRSTGQYPLHGQPDSMIEAFNIAALIVRVFDRVSDYGRGIIAGRIRDALAGQSLGFNPFAVEIGVAAHLMMMGYDVTFMEFENQARFDLLAERDGARIEIDCKAISADLGRPIHSQQLYALGDVAYGDMLALAKRGGGYYIELMPAGSLHNSHDVERVASLLRQTLGCRHDYDMRDIGKARWVEFAIDESWFMGNGRPTAEFGTFLRQHRPAGAAHLLCVRPPGAGGVFVDVVGATGDHTQESMYRELRRSRNDQFSRTFPASIAVRLVDLDASQISSLADRQRSWLPQVATRLFGSTERRHLHSLAFLAPAADMNAAGDLRSNTGRAWSFTNPTHPDAGDERLRLYPSTP